MRGTGRVHVRVDLDPGDFLGGAPCGRAAAIEERDAYRWWTVAPPSAREIQHNRRLRLLAQLRALSFRPETGARYSS